MTVADHAPRCASIVASTGQPCGAIATVEIRGVRYCGTHSPRRKPRGPRKPKANLGNPSDLAELIGQHELTQAGVAAALYTSERQVNNWLNGRNPMPRWAPELLRFKIIHNQV